MKRRGISNKFAFLSLITSVVMIAATIASAYLFIVIGFSNSQIENSIENNKRAYAAIQEYIEQVTSKTKDWANWDDSYYFAKDRNQDYIDVNMEDTAFEALDIHFIRITDNEENIIYQKSHISDASELESYYPI